jgi:outer membrane protein assembly factor BamE (lipoprotein component of BamABCDE complex)
MHFSSVNNIIFYTILLFFLTNCQLQPPKKSHGIVFLENRYNKVKINKTNANDVINIFGEPHSKSFNNDKEWVYFERVLSKGKYHKLGKNTLVANNVLILKFDKYGILIDKKLLKKTDKKKINFSKAQTENDLTQKSFVQKFLQSIKTKMYGK